MSSHDLLQLVEATLEDAFGGGAIRPTGIYGHLDVEDLRAAVATLPELGPNWVQMAPTPQAEPETGTANDADAEGNSWWALQDSNLRPLPCEGSALPLS